MKIRSGLAGVAFLALSFLTGPAAAELPKDTLIRLERSACFGTCPVYSVQVDHRGNVQYEGKKFVGTSGTRSETVPAAAIESLVNEFNAIQFLSLPEGFESRCPIEATDNPSAAISFTFNGRSRTIEEDHGCRGNELLLKVRQLEDKIDSVLQTGKWTAGYQHFRSDSLKPGLN